MSNQTQYGVEGDSVRIECVAFSVPKPDYIVWTFGGSELNSFHNQVINLLNHFENFQIHNTYERTNKNVIEVIVMKSKDF